MYVTTLITNPANPTLEPAVVEALRNAWGGGEVTWLGQELAAEFIMMGLPDNQWSVWEDLQTIGVDMVIQRRGNRRKVMLLADMDSTMIGQECIDELAEEAGFGERVRDVTARAMNGELDFEDALRERVALLEGLNTDVISQVITRRLTFTSGGRELIATMKANDGYAALVSGGFTAFTGHVAGTLGFDEHRANQLHAKDGKLTGTVAEPILGREAKVSALHEITNRLGITSDDVIAVGDGANDLGMLGLAGSGVALHAKPSVAEQCELRINHGDLTALLYLQGYTRDQFVVG